MYQQLTFKNGVKRNIKYSGIFLVLLVITTLFYVTKLLK